MRGLLTLSVALIVGACGTDGDSGGTGGAAMGGIGASQSDASTGGGGAAASAGGGGVGGTGATAGSPSAGGAAGSAGSAGSVATDAGTEGGVDAAVDAMPDAADASADATPDSGDGAVSVDCPKNAPVVLATAPLPWDMALDDTHVYWVTTTSTGSVQRIAKSGGAVQTLAANLDYPRSIFVDGSHVYYGVDGSLTGSPAGAVYRVVKSGGPSVPLVADGGRHQGIVADATHVYWTEFDKDLVRRVPLAGGSVEDFSTTAKRPAQIAVDGSHVYWATFDGGRIEKQPKSGGTPSSPQLVSTTSAQAESIAVDSTWVVWGESAARAWKIPVAGGTKSALEAAPKYIGGVALYGSGVYWTIYGLGANGASVRTMPAAGGAATSLTLGTPLTHAKAIAVDESCVYFSQYSLAGNIMKVSR